MTTDEHGARGARAQRRQERRAARAGERQARALASLIPGGVPADPDPGATFITDPKDELLRRRTFKLVERCHAELVCSREGVALQLFGSDPDSPDHGSLCEQVEALNEEIDDLRELSDELLRRVSSLALTNAELVYLEKKIAAAQAIANPTQRAQALKQASSLVLGALDDTLDKLIDGS